MPTSVTSGTSISPITGFKVLAGLRIGDNDAEMGTEYEYYLMAGTNMSSGQRAWQTNPETEIDSGPVNIALTLNPNGGTNGIAWTVTGG